MAEGRGTSRAVNICLMRLNVRERSLLLASFFEFSVKYRRRRPNSSCSGDFRQHNTGGLKTVRVGGGPGNSWRETRTDQESLRLPWGQPVINILSVDLRRWVSNRRLSKDMET